MFEFILFFLALIPTMLGLAELLHIAKIHILSPKKRLPTYILVDLGDGAPQLQLSLIVEKFRWLGKRYAERIIAVYSDISEKDLYECEKIAEEYNIILCSPENLYYVFSSKLN